MKKSKTDWSALRYLVYFSQVGFTIVTPPLLFAFFSLWLRNRFNLSNWVVIAGILLGVAVAICGLRDFLRLTEKKARQSAQKEKEL